MTAIVFWGLFKRFWWAIPLIGGFWYAYSWVYHRGAESRQPQILQLTQERDAYVAKVKEQQQNFAKAITIMSAESNATLAVLDAKLTNAERRAAAKKVITKEVIKYVSPKADAACTVPIGFVRLHNLAAKNTNPPTPPSEVAASGFEDADTASGVALSTVASTLRDNYATCIDTSEKLEAWQYWYTESKASWDKAAETINKVEAPP